MPFKHEHVFDASAAPRGQLPYIVDDAETIGDSDTIIAHVIAKSRLKIDAALTAGQRDMSVLITGMLDDALYVRFGLIATELMRRGGAMIHSIVSVQTEGPGCASEVN